MSIIINEFDVLVEPPSANGEPPPADSRLQEPQLTPQDIREIERLLVERRARLRAH